LEKAIACITSIMPSSTYFGGNYSELTHPIPSSVVGYGSVNIDSCNGEVATGVVVDDIDRVGVCDGYNSMSTSCSLNSTNTNQSNWVETLAAVAGNVLEWYDFAVFGYFGDIIGDVFFPPNQAGHAAIIESYAVFGGAFLARPLGGLLLGYIGDKYGSRRALMLSIFLMAFPTFAMGCLPSYSRVGPIAIVLLVIVRVMQGMSVGGQLMSSLVFTLENSPRSQWGFYGSLVLATGNVGTLLGGVAAVVIRALLSHEQLYAWGWRVPFLMGIIVSVSGFYLRTSGHGGADEQETEEEDGHQPIQTLKENPLALAMAPSNRRSLVAACLIPMMWSCGFYLSFVWMAVYMADLIEKPIAGSFAINSAAMLFSVCLLLPMVGMLSDWYGRKFIMTIGGLAIFFLSPLLVFLIGRGYSYLAFFAQLILGISMCFWGAAMMPWLAESFHPKVRLTSIAIGYNVGQASIGSMAPSLATYLVDGYSPYAPGFMLSTLAFVALCGLHLVAPAENRSFEEFDSLPTEDSDSEDGISDHFEEELSSV